MSTIFPKLPKVMVHNEFCDLCYTQMEMVDHVPDLIAQHVDISYHCNKCGHHLVFRYIGRLFQKYLDEITKPADKIAQA